MNEEKKLLIICSFLIAALNIFADDADDVWERLKELVFEPTYEVNVSYVPDYENPELDAELRVMAIDLTQYKRVIENEKGRYVVEFQAKGNAKKFLNKGKQAFAKGDYDTAEQYYKKLLEKDPDFSKAYMFIGDCHYSRKEYGKAVIYYRKSLEDNPMDFQAYHFMSDCYYEVGEKDKVKDLLIDSIVMNPRYYFAIDKLKKRGKELGFAYVDEWHMPPPVRVLKTDENKVTIILSGNEGNFTPWYIYGLCKAAIRFEPELEGKIVKKDEPFISSDTEERMCYLFALQSYLILKETEDFKESQINPEFEFINKVYENGDFDTFIYYDVMSKAIPIIPALVEPKVRQEFKDYFKKYHLADAPIIPEEK